MSRDFLGNKDGVGHWAVESLLPLRPTPWLWTVGAVDGQGSQLSPCMTTCVRFWGRGHVWGPRGRSQGLAAASPIFTDHTCNLGMHRPYLGPHHKTCHPQRPSALNEDTASQPATISTLVPAISVSLRTPSSYPCSQGYSYGQWGSLGAPPGAVGEEGTVVGAAVEGASMGAPREGEGVPMKQEAPLGTPGKARVWIRCCTPALWSGH